MKRVLHIISQKPSDTGSGVYLQNLISNGKSNNHLQGIVFGSNCDDDLDVDILDKWRYKIEFESDNMPFSIVGMSDVMPYKSTVFSKLDEEMNKILINSYKDVVKLAIMDFKPDLILCQHLWLLTAITKDIVDNLNLSIPVYGFCHGSDLRQISLSKSHKDIVIMGCKNLDGIFALNEFQLESIKDIYGYTKSKIEVLGNGYNSKYFYRENHNTEINSKKRIIYAGKLSYSKGVISLIKSFKMIDDDTFELFIAGSGHGEEFNEILNVINSTDNVYYLGKLSQSELGAEFRKANIFVLPSFYEGLPLVVIEALACGLKVVCSNIKGVATWIRKYTKDSDVISFVELPNMLDVDKPNPNDLLSFEKRLLESIYKVDKASIDDFDYNLLSELTWEEIFKRINELI